MSIVAIATLASLALLPVGGTQAAVAQPAMTAGEPSHGQTALVDTYWVVKSVVTEDTAIAVPDAPERYVILHGADASLEAYDGCNWRTGPFQISGAVIQLGAIGTTKRACEPSDRAQWVIGQVLSAGDMTFEIDGRLLELARPGLELHLQAQPCRSAGAAGGIAAVATPPCPR